MEPISLTFFADDEVPLPAKIIESTLTLAQIGALACMQCLQKYAGNMDAVEPRLKSEEMAAAMRELVALRVFKVGKSGDAIQMEVDLSPVFPAAAGGAEPAGDWQPPADGAPDKSPAGTNSDSASVEIPYIITTRAVVEKSYNPRFGDDRMCSCGHPYYRHFDTYEGMEPCGCKYCDCASFLESKGPNESSAPDPHE